LAYLQGVPFSDESQGFAWRKFKTFFVAFLRIFYCFLIILSPE